MTSYESLMSTHELEIKCRFCGENVPEIEIHPKFNICLGCYRDIKYGDMNESITFNRKLTKSGNIFYFAVPIEYIRKGKILRKTYYKITVEDI